MLVIFPINLHPGLGLRTPVLVWLEFYAGGRLDNLVSCYCSIEALTGYVSPSVEEEVTAKPGAEFKPNTRPGYCNKFQARTCGPQVALLGPLLLRCPFL